MGNAARIDRISVHRPGSRVPELRTTASGALAIRKVE
jgi:hypothetical protein